MRVADLALIGPWGGRGSIARTVAHRTYRPACARCVRREPVTLGAALTPMVVVRCAFLAPRGGMGSIARFVADRSALARFRRRLAFHGREYTLAAVLASMSVVGLALDAPGGGMGSIAWAVAHESERTPDSFVARRA